MKKGLKILLTLTTLLAMPLTLASCGETNGSSENPTSVVDENQEIVNSALAALTVPGETTQDLNLVTSGLGGAVITWASDNAAIAINGSKGVVTRSTEADVSVKLTATATKGSATGTREFTVIVKKHEVAEHITVREAIEATVGTNLTVKGVVSNYAFKDDSQNAGEQYKQGMYVTDATGTIYVYGPKVAQSVNIGDEIIFDAVKDEYARGTKPFQQLESPANVVTLNSNVKVPLDSAISGKTMREVLDDTNALHNTYIMDIKVQAYDGGTYVNYEIMDSAGTWMLLEGSSSGAEFESLVSDTLQTMAFSICATTKKDVWKAVIIDSNVTL